LKDKTVLFAVCYYTLQLIVICHNERKNRGFYMVFSAGIKNIQHPR
jgi:hypothetical protein